MRKGTFIATIALLIAIAGAIVAFAAYFKRRNCALCDELDGEMNDDELSDLDYYATQVDEDDENSECNCGCGCGCGCENAEPQENTAEPEVEEEQ